MALGGLQVSYLRYGWQRHARHQLGLQLLLGRHVPCVLKGDRREIEGLHGTETRESKIHGRGVFVTEDVEGGEYVMEYTGIRRSGPSARALHRALDYRRLSLHGLVTVNVDSDDEMCIIDPRNSGNDAQYLNHSCEPNCLLETTAVRDRYIVKVLALDLTAGTEATINFGRRARSMHNRIECNCQARGCVGYLWA